MSKKNFITLIVILVAVLSLVFAILLLATGGQTRYVNISYNRALREMPEVEITEQEFAAMRAAFQSEVVQHALQQPIAEDVMRKVLLPMEQSELLFAAILPASGVLGDIAVIDETLYMDYTRENDRFILECLPDGRVRKTIARYENINVPTQGKVSIYTSNNNERYRKY